MKAVAVIQRGNVNARSGTGTGKGTGTGTKKAMLEAMHDKKLLVLVKERKKRYVHQERKIEMERCLPACAVFCLLYSTWGQGKGGSAVPRRAP